MTLDRGKSERSVRLLEGFVGAERPARLDSHALRDHLSAMHPLLALVSLIVAGPFHEADSSAWRYQVGLQSYVHGGIPGGDDFHVPPEDQPVRSLDGGAGAACTVLRLVAYAPRRGSISWFGSIGYGLDQATWDMDVTPVGGRAYSATMELSHSILDLSGGAELRMARRHFVVAELGMPIPLGRGKLDSEVDGVKVFSGDAPESFGLSMLPRLMVHYDYRLLDRIDVGLGVSLFHPGYFADTPTLKDDTGRETRLTSGAESGIWSLHLGWTFGG